MTVARLESYKKLIQEIAKMCIRDSGSPGGNGV